MKPLLFPKPNGHDKVRMTKVRGRTYLVKESPPLSSSAKKHLHARANLQATALRRVIDKVQQRKQILPLEFMLNMLNDAQEPKSCRMWAAEKAAPYLHRRMPIAIEGGDASRPLVFATAEQLQGLPTNQLKVMMDVLSRFSREELAKHTGVEGLLPATIDNATGEVDE